MAELASHATPVCRMSQQIRKRVCVELDDVVSLQVLAGPIDVASQITLAVDSDIEMKDEFVQYFHANPDQHVAVGEVVTIPNVNSWGKQPVFRAVVTALAGATERLHVGRVTADTHVHCSCEDIAFREVLDDVVTQQPAYQAIRKPSDDATHAVPLVFCFPLFWFWFWFCLF
jgi:hypothetical protein